VIQVEIEPFTWAGLFDQEEEAVEFLENYREQYMLDDTSHFELYKADLELIDKGGK